MGAFTQARLVVYARELGRDAERFRSCLASGETLSRVLDDTREGRGFDFAGTPSFLVNDLVAIGAQAYAPYASLLDTLLTRVCGAKPVPQHRTTRRAARGSPSRSHASVAAA